MPGVPTRTAALTVLALTVAACGAGPGGTGRTDDDRVLSVSAIPDQDPEVLQRLYGGFADYLSDTIDTDVRYVPVTDYTASVAAFRRGDLDMVFFGGLTGVQARLQVPGAIPIAQRDIDERFRTVFVANTGTDLEPIDDVAGLTELADHTFTFGSESSTSGRLMPQAFLTQAGLSLDDFTGQVGFANSHDTTAKLVEAGTYDAGALNSAVWDERVSAGALDTSEVREIFRTPPYHDYHWLARPDLDERFGTGFTDRLTDALLALDGSDDREREILDLFHAGKFIATKPDNYDQIEAVARDIGLVN